MSDAGEPTRGRGILTPGTKVEVRSALDGSWADGFVVAQRTDDGYRLQRRSDGHLLPALFPFDDVRRERKTKMWWY